MPFMHRVPLLALLALLLVACSDPQGGAMQNQSLGLATGWFAQLQPDNVLCSLMGIGEPTMDLTFYLGPDVDKDVSTVRFLPFVEKGQRVQQGTSLQYGIGDTVPGAIEVERGAAIVDPRFTDEALATALATHTSFYFPLTVHRLRVEPGTICFVDPVTGFRDTTDCIDVPAGSGLEGAHYWCSVSVTVDGKWSE
jgi:hypothetical protein